MITDWNKVTINDIAFVRGGKRLPKGENLQAKPSNHPYIRSRDIRNNTIVIRGIEYVPNNVFPSIARYIVDKGDLIITIVGANYGDCALVPEELDKASLTENCAKLLPINSEILHIPFLFYNLISIFGQRLIRERVVGSSQPKLPLYGIQSIPLLLPSIYEQKAISYLLGTLDTKIETNKKINETLEEMAKSLFKSWFINFDPVKAKSERRSTGLSDEISNLFPDSFENSKVGNIPKGWEVTQIANLVKNISRGISPKYTDQEKYPVINQKCIRNSQINFSLCKFTEYKKNMDSKFLSKFDILVNSMGVGTLGRVSLFINYDKNILVDGCVTFIRGKREIDSLFIFQNLSLRESEIINLSTGSTGQISLSKESLLGLEIVKPGEKILEIFSSFIKDLYTQKHNNSTQNNYLISLRNTLLTKLISGKLRIPDAEKMIEEVEI